MSLGSDVGAFPSSRSSASRLSVEPVAVWLGWVRLRPRSLRQSPGLRESRRRIKLHQWVSIATVFCKNSLIDQNNSPTEPISNCPVALFNMIVSKTYYFTWQLHRPIETQHLLTYLPIFHKIQANASMVKGSVDILNKVFSLC